MLQHVDSRMLLSNMHAAHTAQPRQLFKMQQSTLSHRLLRFRPKFLCPCKKVECVLLIREVATEVALLTAEKLLWVRCICEPDAKLALESSARSL